MKRHGTLTPLSREHHSALILAQLLKKGAPAYKGLPTGNAEKIMYAQKMFHNSLKEHFKKEELLINNVQHCHEDIQKLGKEIFIEHEQLTRSFLNLDKATDPVESMDELGSALDAHIRKEERVLFPLVQEHCPEKDLTEISILLQ
ncbi:MAG: hemerythrin domain-containing protein [Ferruginibacter sp.]